MPIFTDEQLDRMRDTLSSVRTQTVSVLPYDPGAEDEFGNETEAWGTAIDYEDGSLTPLTATEILDDRNVQLTDKKLRLPHDAEISGRDLVVCGGLTYEIITPPEHHQAPDGVLQTTAVVRLIEGE